MEEHNVISTDFASKYDLSHLYMADEAVIVSELSKKGEPTRSSSTLKTFLQLSPGDIVAIKSRGYPKRRVPFLEIVAYAVVVERDGVVYWHDRENLGHCINVQFIKSNFRKEFQLGGYSRTIHKITDQKIISILFEGYKTAQSKEVRRKIRTRRWKRVNQKA
jgi:hypothetical protein